MTQFSSDIFARVMRLVVPMRREFKTNIDVQNFLYNLTYAKDVLDLAMSSQNERVQENAEYLRRMFLGPRESDLHLTETRLTVGEQFKGQLGIGEAAGYSGPSFQAPTNIQKRQDFGLNG